MSNWKRECPNCGTVMEACYLTSNRDGSYSYEEWYCEECEFYYEYKDGEIVKRLNLEGSGDVDV